MWQFRHKNLSGLQSCKHSDLTGLFPEVNVAI
jgi:hypothetical protein